jgi:hypothetical protein
MAATDEPAERSLNAFEHALSGDVPPAELVRADRVERLRTELATEVASAELAQALRECERASEERETWRSIAEERGRALERSDFVLQTLAGVLTNLDRHAPPSSAQSLDLTAITRELAAATRELAAVSRMVAEARDIPAARVVGATPPERVAGHATKERDDAPEALRPESVYRSLLDSLAPGDLEPDDAEIVSVPAYVREEAERYAQTMQAIQDYKLDLARPRHWWQFWR